MSKEVAFLFLILFLAGCGGSNATALPPQATPIWNANTGSHVFRFHDDEKSVTCWVLEGFNRGGISCVPDSQLRGELR